MYLPAIILFGVGVLVAYFAGVKAGRAWGTPLLVVCLIGVLGTVGNRYLRGERLPPPPPNPVSSEKAPAQALGRLMSEDLADDAIVTIVWMGAGSDRTERTKLWEVGLKETLGDGITIDYSPPHGLGFSPPGGWPAVSTDALVFVAKLGFVGIEEGSDPLIAVYFGPLQSEEPSISSEKVRAMREAGDVHVALRYAGKGLPAEEFPLQ